MTVQVTRLPIQLLPDPRRVITRYFAPGEVNRIKDIVERLMAFPEAEVEEILATLESNYRPIHPDIDDVYREHFEMVVRHIENAGEISDARRRLIGACFTMEYAIESAALFNPSIVPAIDQTGLPLGSVRFLMRLRATGEGHLSSIVFRRGVIDGNGGVSIDPPGQFSRSLAAVVPDAFNKAYFVRELHALGAWTENSQHIMDLLGDRFTCAQLSDAIDTVRAKSSLSGKSEESNDALLSLTRANYELRPPPGSDISELVIFPFSENERHGVEDLRLVRFTEQQEKHCYYGTYTAYNGSRIFPQLIESHDGQSIQIHMLTGCGAKNKGMALFPRKIRGKYAMVCATGQRELILYGVR